MARKVSKSADVEALRERLATMPRAAVIELCAKADVSYSTIQKFRKRHTGDIGGDKYAALISALPKGDKPNHRKARA